MSSSYDEYPHDTQSADARETEEYLWRMQMADSMRHTNQMVPAPTFQPSKAVKSTKKWPDRASQLTRRLAIVLALAVPMTAILWESVVDYGWTGSYMIAILAWLIMWIGIITVSWIFSDRQLPGSSRRDDI